MSSQPRIGIDCRMIPNSGIGTCIKEIVPRLIEAHPDWRFELFGYTRDMAGLGWRESAQVTFRPFETPIYTIQEQLGWLARQTNRPDILWVPHMNIPLLWPGKLMVTVHDVCYLALPEMIGPVKRAYARLFFQRIRRRADAISFVSHFTRDEFIRLAGRPARHFEVIHNGVDDRWSAPPAALPLPPEVAGVPYIICVGNLKPNKNIPRLLQAFALLRGRVPHHLVVVGKKEGFLTADDSLKSVVAELDDRVWFTGYVDDDLLRLLVRHADALVHPSLYEGFGLTPLEAMAAGCPAIISNAGSLPEIGGAAARYFSPLNVTEMADTIAGLLQDSAARANLIGLGLTHAATFNWQSSATKLSSLLSRLLQS